MNKLNFQFKNKEGKYFAPIVQTVPNYQVRDGAVTEVGKKIRGGVKGVYAKVKFTITSDNKAELFAINTEFFPSSN